MIHSVQHPLPTHEEILAELPLDPKIAEKIARDREEVASIISGNDPRLLVVVGPCSAWPSESVVKYAKKLAPIAEELGDRIKIVMRTYIQKPRTVAGWMGPLVQPDPTASADIPAGVRACRKMMLEVLALGLPISDEILFPRKASYFRDLFSWAAIGARSSENQEHRILASMQEFAIGLKNPTSGSIRVGINSVRAAQSPNVFALDGHQVETSGNPYAHLVLRGGSAKPNCRAEHLQKTLRLMSEVSLKNPAVMIDASHENCVGPDGKKDPLRQPEVIRDVLATCADSAQIRDLVRGFMIESFLVDGNQKLGSENIQPGCSVTDPCLGWERTEVLLREMHAQRG